MSTPTSFRLPDDVRGALRQQATKRGTSSSQLAGRLLDEGLRMLAHPGIVFRDGPGGRRAGLSAGPDVAEVVAILHRLDVTGEEAVVEVTAWLEQPMDAIRAAISYYVEFTTEIDDELRARDEAAEAARAHHERRLQLLR